MAYRFERLPNGVFVKAARRSSRVFIATQGSEDLCEMENTRQARGLARAVYRYPCASGVANKYEGAS